ncbi:MAG TPA: NADH-quinone oxidoreductase subunit D, partial [Saprospiraceae bacterium]|nr:NADH-quinone oxidoreductase subunit D [Saprospiraceae bacterium]
MPPEQTKMINISDDNFEKQHVINGVVQTGDELKQYNYLNLGPTHPATHGIFQNILKMDGEIIVDAQPTIGYIHRAFEKLAENRPFFQITTITDRLNYCSAPINNIGWHLTMEKLLGIETPKRVDYLRVIVMELARIADHIICNSVVAVDTGALTGFLYVFQWREKIYDVYEEICGARLTTNMGRIGGFERDFSKSAFDKIDVIVKELPKALQEFEKLVIRNRIFMDRTINVGGISGERALEYGFTGPNLRAAGVDYDVRVMNPYCSYQDFDFTIPVGSNGDTYDRFCVRQEEMWQSLSIIKQAVKNLPEGKHHADVPEFYLPPKDDVYNSMEGLIWHFK